MSIKDLKIIRTRVTDSNQFWADIQAYRKQLMAEYSIKPITKEFAQTFFETTNLYRTQHCTQELFSNHGMTFYKQFEKK